jgi:hypothetical protein
MTSDGVHQPRGCSVARAAGRVLHYRGRVVSLLVTASD